jgi:nucleoside-diphosphate kinase
MGMERTLVIVKPDAMQRGLMSAILSRLEARGLKLVGLKLVAVDEALARRHYAVHEGKPFFAGLIQYITSSPVVVAVYEGCEAVAVVRSTVGATNPVNAAPGTIRGDWALEIGRNLIHASDAPDTAATEVALWFRPEELVSYERAADRWVFE